MNSASTPVQIEAISHKQEEFHLKLYSTSRLVWKPTFEWSSCGNLLGIYIILTIYKYVVPTGKQLCNWLNVEMLLKFSRKCIFDFFRYAQFALLHTILYIYLFIIFRVVFTARASAIQKFSCSIFGNDCVLEKNKRYIIIESS